MGVKKRKKNNIYAENNKMNLKQKQSKHQTKKNTHHSPSLIKYKETDDL